MKQLKQQKNVSPCFFLQKDSGSSSVQYGQRFSICLRFSKIPSGLHVWVILLYDVWVCLQQSLWSGLVLVLGHIMDDDLRQHTSFFILYTSLPQQARFLFLGNSKRNRMIRVNVNGTLGRFSNIFTKEGSIWDFLIALLYTSPDWKYVYLKK